MWATFCINNNSKANEHLANLANVKRFTKLFHDAKRET